MGEINMGEFYNKIGRIYSGGNLTSKQVTALKNRLRKDVGDRPALFDACWRMIMKFANQGDISDYQHLRALYDSIASEKVNNPRSKFYMHG
jgi:hypothetical protein